MIFLTTSIFRKISLFPTDLISWLYEVAIGSRANEIHDICRNGTASDHFSVSKETTNVSATDTMPSIKGKITNVLNEMEFLR